MNITAGIVALYAKIKNKGSKLPPQASILCAHDGKRTKGGVNKQDGKVGKGGKKR